MNPLKVFESPEAKIKDGRFERIIVPKRILFPVNFIFMLIG